MLNRIAFDIICNHVNPFISIEGLVSLSRTCKAFSSMFGSDQEPTKDPFRTLKRFYNKRGNTSITTVIRRKKAIFHMSRTLKKTRIADRTARWKAMLKRQGQDRVNFKKRPDVVAARKRFHAAMPSADKPHLLYINTMCSCLTHMFDTRNSVRAAADIYICPRCYPNHISIKQASIDYYLGPHTINRLIAPCYFVRVNTYPGEYDLVDKAAIFALFRKFHGHNMPCNFDPEASGISVPTHMLSCARCSLFFSLDARKHHWQKKEIPYMLQKNRVVDEPVQQ